MTQSTQQPASDEALKNATGKTWNEWFALLDTAGAKEMSHKDIARWLYDQKLVESGWWCQSITVGYERFIGRRQEGQGQDGTFETATSKTIAGDLGHALAAWLKKVEGIKAFNRIPLMGEPTTKETDGWRYWRAKLADDSRVVVTISAKSPDKSAVTVSHEKISDKAAAEEWRTYWKAFLAEL